MLCLVAPVVCLLSNCQEILYSSIFFQLTISQNIVNVLTYILFRCTIDFRQLLLVSATHPRRRSAR